MLANRKFREKQVAQSKKKIQFDFGGGDSGQAKEGGVNAERDRAKDGEREKLFASTATKHVLIRTSRRGNGKINKSERKK